MDDELLNNLPRTQEKAEKTPEEKPSTLEWARDRFAQMSPEEQAKSPVRHKRQNEPRRKTEFL